MWPSVPQSADQSAWVQLHIPQQRLQFPDQSVLGAFPMDSQTLAAMSLYLYVKR